MDSLNTLMIHSSPAIPSSSPAKMNEPNRVDFGQGDSGDDRAVLGKVQGTLGMPFVWNGLKHPSPANNTRPSLAKRKVNFAMGYARQRHGLPRPGQPYYVA
ncbi:hypothetical protein Syun_001311 [Stephania yunnanensis]|uniref:Uncharacterized protein n=1 Tax=Stephania yunnanensis TaxID=152371 RepID=A0AAP0LDV3_9MAGN